MHADFSFVEAEEARKQREQEAANRRFLIILWLMSAIAVGCFIGALVTGARAHEAPSGWKYPLECCSNRDCTEVPASRVSEGPQGYRVTLLPGDHDFITAAASYLIPYASTKPSPDGVFHICILPNMSWICFFAGARGF